jgi:site-specific DNA recombinase
MPVATYLRVSTEEQRERQSIETQREFGDRYRDLHKLQTYRVYEDDGVSGTVPLDQREQGGQILRDARLGRFDQLLVYRLDRLGRDTRLILNAVDELEKLGVRVRSMTEEFDTGTASGRLMLTMLSGFAAHERDVIRERSVAGTNRVAESGAWMGGIVPYGYRKTGEKRDGRLVVSEDLIPGLAMSEADVIREVFRMAAVEGKSCRHIAERLNSLQIPCAYVRDDRLTLRGKRKERTSGLWRPGRIRGLITNKTYMGTHEFGKRAAGRRTVISRPCAAIVTEDVWQKAQATLRANFLFCARSAKTQYLLRGLIKCGTCGLTYVGSVSNRPTGRSEFYYRCNGTHSPQFCRPQGRCDSKAIRGDRLEQQVWTDVEAFLRDPKPILERLHARFTSDANGLDQARSQTVRLEELLAEKATERSRILGLYRRGRLTDAALDEQMEEIGKEEAGLGMQIKELRCRVTGADSIRNDINSAQALLEKLRKRLDEPISWELKRRIVEILVAGVRVDTVENCGVRQAEITVTYRFGQPDQPAVLILGQSYGTGSVIRIPLEPKTIGDHVRKKRLGLKLLQRDVAEQLGVNVTSVRNWESNLSQPTYRNMPAVVTFLGYNPLEVSEGWANRLVQGRTVMGLSQKESAHRIGVDPSTLAKWERGERNPTGVFEERVASFLALAEGTFSSFAAKTA